MPLTPFNGTLGPKRAAHLLRRATFGPSLAQVDEFANDNAATAVSKLFAEMPLPPEPTPLFNGGEEEGENSLFFKGWWMKQMLAPTASAREKIVFFLHTHFTTIESFVENPQALYYQSALFRIFAFDLSQPDFNFKVLSKKISLDNAMLKFLDGDTNVKGSVNENYAREFLELYTIGKGREGVPLPDPNLAIGDYFYFTEEDIQAGARVLSGYRLDNDFSIIDEETGLPRCDIRANQHDNDPKTFSNRFGNQVIAPRPELLSPDGRPTPESMDDELEQMVEMIYAQAETALYICRRIYRFFVYHDISEEINNTIIPAMADTFVSSGYKLQAVLEDLFRSQHFYDAAVGLGDDKFGGIIKSPLDLVMGTLRFFELDLPDPETDTEQFLEVSKNLLNYMQDQGMNLYEPFEVAGYAAYHQYPEYNRNWISTNSLTQRYQFIRELVNVETMMEPGRISLDILAYTKANFDDSIALDPALLLRAYLSYLFPRFEEGDEITTERLEYFRTEFLKLGEALPQGALVFWQFSWSNAANIPASEADARGMLVDLMNAMLQSPEYQLF